MLRELDRYPLCQVAREFGERQYVCKENLLGLLMEGKVVAHVDDGYFKIDIPSAHWNSVTQGKFTIFNGPGLSGREYYLSITASVLNEYRKKLECLDVAASQCSDACIPRALWDDILFEIGTENPRDC